MKQSSIAWVGANLALPWPQAGTPGAFNWNLLNDGAQRSGSARFDSPYWRANLSPAERCVLSVPGSTAYRMKPTGSGFSNLYVAGAGTLNGLNFGCIGSATRAGLEVPQAIYGCPTEIAGQTDL